ncbi:MAG: 50S ribosomal protein L21 [Lentimicrobiaceae bacterium]|jgi:large subunit ribosomal protein L21|nr:50S ribosomal protein L21 [Lentimicrobiaceae bacterium]MCP4909975.1 50S ribosomal protein L21 [Bacteroidota bacterium]MBT3453912.1 50S ribosomal protein L21 [Lentimicrobiaceae bacterium]MBT3819068.1 50S ribosomal protein L21 [Lentimicrobiaceae bacterium]MBT4062384.1 50S ribosomal protein L21 [Lentimicrobiaceae bacterium]
MYVVVDIAGQQFKVEQGQEVFVNRLEGKEGEKVKFDKVLLVDDKGAVKVGTPLVEGAGVDAQIVSHLKGDKVVVFKKKRRKGYQKSNGFRADLSKVLIKKITV